MKDLREKVILITGATGGFGSEMCRQFLAEGAHVIATDLENQALERLRDRLDPGPGRFLGSFTANLDSKDGSAQVFERAGRITPAVDVLVNNAGIAQIGRFVDLPDDEWEKTVNINLLAPMRLTRLFLPGMLERGSGHVVNISSAAGLTAAAMMAPYSASKFGLRGFGDSIAEEVEDAGVRVTNVYPFFSRTNILKSERFGALPDKELPDWLVTDPVKIVQAIVKGVKADERQVYPDAAARIIDISEKLVPAGVQNWYKKFMRGFAK